MRSDECVRGAFARQAARRRVANSCVGRGGRGRIPRHEGLRARPGVRRDLRYVPAGRRGDGGDRRRPRRLGEPPSDHVDFCEKECVLRAAPLKPAGLLIRLAEAAFQSGRWAKMTGESDAGVRYLLREQALTAIAGRGGGAADEGGCTRTASMPPRPRRTGENSPGAARRELG
jgi:hypothetical protein